MLLFLTAGAKAQDTLVVPPGSGTLNKAILGDTTANGARTNSSRVYQLARGGRYLAEGQIRTGKYHLRIIGEPAPAGGADPGPAVIQAGPRSGGGVDALVLNIYGDITLKNLWVLSWTTTNTRQWSNIQCEGDSTTAVIDRCIFEWAQGPAITVDGKHMRSVTLTNNVFRNCIDPTQWWAGRAIYFRSAPVDSVTRENNTFENMGIVFQTQGVGLKHFWWNHNTHLNVTKFPLLESYWTDAVITNNVFVNCHYTGERKTDRINEDPDLLLYGAVLSIDTLLQAYTMPESQRRLLFFNNSNFTDPAFQAFYDSYNSTHTADPILAEPLMNDRAKNMFSWHASMRMGNVHDSTDPGFIRPPDNRDSMIAFLRGRYASPPVMFDWGWDSDVPTGTSNKRSVTGWPLPENLAYTNPVLLSGGTSGYPLGDLNWFPEKIVSWQAQRSTEEAIIRGYLTGVSDPHGRNLPGRYLLEQNFPNPFNPATIIRFTVPRPGNVRLEVFDLLGRQVRSLINGRVDAGQQTLQWDGKDDEGIAIGSGVYFYQLAGDGGFVEVKRMILIR